MSMDQNKKTQFIGKHAGEFLRDAVKEGYDLNEIIDMSFAFAMSVCTLMHMSALTDDMSEEQKNEIAKDTTHMTVMHYGKVSEKELRKKGYNIKSINSFFNSPESKR